VKTIAVLLEHGADPNAPDDNGLTPLDWLERAAKSADRDAVRRLLRHPHARWRTQATKTREDTNLK
jgi:ankyrin repeat protein